MIATAPLTTGKKKRGRQRVIDEQNLNRYKYLYCCCVACQMVQHNDNKKNKKIFYLEGFIQLNEGACAETI